MAFLKAKRNPDSYLQADSMKETLKKFGKNTDAFHEAMNAIKVSKVSFSKEFEDFRRLPKYTHVPLAVIHPSPIKRLAHPKRPKPEFELEASPSRMNTRPGPKFEIPESL